MAGPKVLIYTLSTCSHCKAAKKLMGESIVPYDFIDVDLLEGDKRESTIKDLKKINPGCSFPTIVIGSLVIVGYKENDIKEALGI